MYNSISFRPKLAHMRTHTVAHMSKSTAVRGTEELPKHSVVWSQGKALTCNTWEIPESSLQNKPDAHRGNAKEKEWSHRLYTSFLLLRYVSDHAAWINLRNLN